MARRVVWLLLAVVLAAGLLAACGPMGSGPGSPARPAHRAAGRAAAAPPVLYRCSGRPTRRPVTFNVACGDGNGKYDQMSWRHWGGGFAAGRGRQWFNTCTPYCAAGNYERYRVRVRLLQVRRSGARSYFTRMRVVRRARAPHRQTFPLPTP